MKKTLLFGAIALCFNTFAQVPNYVPTNGLVAWYSFNGNANDDGINANNGIVNGAIPSTDRFLVANSAYSFNGIDDYIEINTTNGTFDNQSFTISFWITCNTFSSAPEPSFISRLSQTDGPYDNFVCFEFQGQFGYNAYNGGAGPGGISSGGINPPIVSTNDWQFITVTFSDSIRNYENGVLSSTNVYNGPSYYNVNKPIRFGKSNNPYWQDFTGELDDIGFWNRALNNCEIQDLYNSQLNSTSFSVAQNGATLTADQAGATYQWLDCDNSNAIIAGETNQSYTPTITGNYSVQVNMNGCIDTSTCFLVDFTGLNEINNKSLIKVYPNPSSETFTLELDVNSVGSSYIIYNQLGAIVKKGIISNSNQIVDVSNLASGVYDLSIEQTDLRAKLVKD